MRLLYATPKTMPVLLRALAFVLFLIGISIVLSVILPFGTWPLGEDGGPMDYSERWLSGFSLVFGGLGTFMILLSAGMVLAERWVKYMTPAFFLLIASVVSFIYGRTTSVPFAIALAGTALVTWYLNVKDSVVRYLINPKQPKTVVDNRDGG